MRWVGIIAFCTGFLSIGVPGSTGAATLDFTGTLGINIFGFRESPSTPPVYLTVTGSGAARLTDDGDLHLLSFALSPGAFGPATVTYDLPSWVTVWVSQRFTLSQNLSGSFSGISGGSSGSGPMGLSGMAKICAWSSACSTSLLLPLTPTAGGAGFGIGGMRTEPASIAVTMSNAPWTIGQPVMTIHTPGSTVTTPALPGGFAHGPVSLTSSTARPSGALQLVTVSKVYTSLTSGFPEVPVTGVLTLQFVPEPGTLLLVVSGMAPLALLAWWHRNK